jgi:8-amino-3,8-dideoxy-alpha-D-manno-octulosonate transaminase
VRNAITPRTKCIMPVHMCGSMADLDTLQEICREHKLILLEDACQSIGAMYKGKYLGTIGDAGTFSFDFVKTITCAEGGAVLTNNKDLHTKVDGFSDHGHDHIGNDRGLEQHPFIGYNYRISELHAAVGLAQIRKLDKFLAIQKKNHAQLKAILSGVPEISFRAIPDPAGDSCTFLSWFLPTEELAQALVKELKDQKIFPGNFYWYNDHNWHYIRKWEHLRNAATLYRLNDPQVQGLEKIAAASFPASDAVMGRCISTAISMAWTEAQITEKGEKIAAAVRKVLSRQGVSL